MCTWDLDLSEVCILSVISIIGELFAPGRSDRLCKTIR